MYTKTQWVDNTTPIDKDNLNKIEQGIYDNSLVVDAVTNTLNPTDTETYKTAELTEGQITDVIGVSDIVIKGDTEQDGTPTPSAPVDVNVVSGSNVINTGNENLFPLILDVEGTQILQQRCNVIIQKDEFIFTATGTDMYFGNVATANSDYQKLQGKLIKIPANAQNIYLKVSNNAFSNNFICFFDENKVSLGYSNISTSKEIPSTAKYFTLRIGVSNSVSGTTYKTKVMVSTMDKAYVPYQGKELPLDLGKNLANIDDIQLQKNWQNVADTTRASIVNIKVKPSTTYTLSSSYTSSSITNVRCILFGEIGDITHKGVVSGTFTTTSTTHYLSIEVIANTTFTQSMLNGLKIQLEKGDTATTYVPYDPDPIELCKIGDYQDYFYKSGSKWYLHKEIGKVVLDGTESWTADSSNQRAYSSVIADNVLRPATTDIVLIGLCDKLQVLNFTDVYINKREGLCSSSAGVLSLHITGVTDITFNENDFKTWLASNNVTLYYVLETSTDTEITDTTLIFQLEAIYNAPLYEQTNITQTNNDLPMVLNITACKDNINGIKAFIRK